MQYLLREGVAEERLVKAYFKWLPQRSARVQKVSRHLQSNRGALLH